MKKNSYLPAVLCTLCAVACVLRTCIEVIEKPDEKIVLSIPGKSFFAEFSGEPLLF